MPNDNNDLEKLRDKLFQPLRDEMQREFTPKQKAFFNLPELVEEGGQYVVRHLGSRAWLSACGEAIHLSMIQTDESRRGQGDASQLLKMICSFADRVGVTLSLRAEPKARKLGLVQDQLVEWYGRYGFEGGWEKMTRRPMQLDGGFTGETPGSGESMNE